MAASYISKISNIADASKEFLTIVVGLALAYAIATRGPAIPGVNNGSLTIWSNEVGALLVYIIYASRFYINNWLYLSESYNREHLQSLQLDDPSNVWKARLLLARAYFDLTLTVYTAILISLSSVFGLSASGTLNAAQWHDVSWWLMVCVIAHYGVDAIVLFITIVISDDNTLLNRIRSAGWIANNVVFIVLFAANLEKVEYGWLLRMLFYNCAIAILVTGVSPLLAHIAMKLKQSVDGPRPA